MLSLALAALLSAAPAPVPVKGGFTPRQRPYDVQNYRLDLTLENDGTFANKVSITLTPKGAQKVIELDSYGLAVKAVNAPAGFTATFTQKDEAQKRNGQLTVTFDKPLPAGQPQTFSVEVTGAATELQEGLFVTKNPEKRDAPPYFFTQLEPTYARRLFPCNDQPDDKATTEIFATVDTRYQVLSNGKQVLDEAFSKDGKNLRRSHWVQDKPHSTYLVALAVGVFEEVKVQGDTPAALFVLPGTKDRAFVGADVTHFALNHQTGYLNTKYPWERHLQVVVPRFFWGGMENTGLVTMRESGLVLENKNHLAGKPRIVGLVSHELAHQWFGDYVTPKWWDDMWLNEGFASWLGAKTTAAYFENEMVDVANAESLLSDYFREEDGPRAHPLVGQIANSPEDFFDSTSYDKGAAVLRMLEHWLGPQEMKAGLKAYLETYGTKNASSADFFAAMVKANKREKDKELRAFQEAWLKKKGYPVLEVQRVWNGNQVTLTVTQKPNHAGEKGPFVFKLPIVMHRESDPAFHEERTILVDKPTVSVSFEVPASPNWVNWNKNHTALVRFDTSLISEGEWTQAARKDPDPTWRLVADYALVGEMGNPDAKAAARPTDGAMNALKDVLELDPSPYVREAVMKRLASSKAKVLPIEFAPSVFEMAKSPKGLGEDALGRIKVRNAALGLLGKFEHAEGRRYLLEQILEDELDLNYLPGLAVGVGRIGDSTAMANLRAALQTQRGRGYAYYKAAAAGLGSVQSVEVIPALNEFIRDNPGNNELARAVLGGLPDNAVVKTSPEGINFVKAFVLENKTFGDEMKAQVLSVLDEVRGEPAKVALTEVAEKSDSERLRTMAKATLEKGWPAAPVAPVKAPAKGKKK